MLLCYSNFYDIFIPFLCSLVGGILAFLGVWVSILNDNKKKKYELKLLNKPYFYTIELISKDDKIDHYIRNGKYDGKYDFNGIFRNTDNAIFRIINININDQIVFKPFYGRIIDKNSIFSIHFRTDVKPKLSMNIVLTVEDVLGNAYLYLLEYKISTYKSYVIKGLTEVDSAISKEFNIKLPKK